MTVYVLTPAAQRDLGGIWDYTAKRWNRDQADRYILGIRDACAALASGRSRGRPIDEVRPGYLKFSVASQFLFFRMTPAGDVEIVRILHQRMDAPARLQD